MSGMGQYGRQNVVKIFLFGSVTVAAGATWIGNSVDISKYKSFSAAVNFDSAPGTLLQMRVQEILVMSTGNSVYNDTTTYGSALTNANALFQKKTDSILGDTARIIVNNTDTVSHNAVFSVISGWRN